MLEVFAIFMLVLCAIILTVWLVVKVVQRIELDAMRRDVEIYRQTFGEYPSVEEMRGE